MTHILVDYNNLLFRIKHAVRGDADTKGAMGLHVCFNAIFKAWRMFDGHHVVVAGDGAMSWRRQHLKEYKAHRRVTANLRSANEIEEDNIFFSYVEKFTEFLSEKSNVTVIRIPTIEADDVIARWIALHPDDQHVIISNDSDFYQLLAPNVKIYKGTTSETVTLDGVFDDKGKHVIDERTKKPKAGPDPEWELFMKICRGDPGDNIERAVLKGARETKIREAFDDRKNRGFSWNNLMLNEWEDANGQKKRVIDRYNENTLLIDLKKQPEEIKKITDEGIQKAIAREKIPSSKIGFYFLKFCTEYDLKNLQKYPENYTSFLSASYKVET